METLLLHFSAMTQMPTKTFYTNRGPHSLNDVTMSEKEPPGLPVR